MMLICMILGWEGRCIGAWGKVGSLRVHIRMGKVGWMGMWRIVRRVLRIAELVRMLRVLLPIE
jgi:hypothetical protein